VDERTVIAIELSFMGHQSFPSLLDNDIQEGAAPEVGHLILEKSGSAEGHMFFARIEPETRFEQLFYLL
jgi:hypothetical protein